MLKLIIMVRKCKGTRVPMLRILSVAAVALGLCAALPFARAELSIAQECAKLEAEKKFDEAYEQRCGHGKMLKEGSNVYTIYQLHAEKKVELIGKKSAADLPALQKDGTCLNDAKETFDACKARLKRAAIDARVQARKNITENNRGRVDLIDEKGDLQIERSGGGGGGPAGKTTIMKDFKDAKGKDPRDVLSSGAKSVSFGTEDKAGDGVLNADKLEKVKGEDIEKLNSDVAATMDPNQKVLEAVNPAGGKDEKFSLKGKGAAKLRDDVRKDQADLSRANDTPVKKGTKSLSSEAFDDVISSLDQKAKDEGAGKKGSEARPLEERDVEQGIENSKDPKNPKAGGLDKLIIDDFNSYPTN